MSETVYIKTDKNIEVSKRMVLIGDVADVYCNNKKMENDIKHICLIILDEVGVNKIKKKRVCLSFMDIVKAVAKKYPERIQLVPVQDEYELKDVDTQKDLLILLNRFKYQLM